MPLAWDFSTLRTYKLYHSYEKGFMVNSFRLAESPGNSWLGIELGLTA